MSSLSTNKIKNKIKKLSFIDAIKITIIILVSFALFGNILPFYGAIDPLIYANTAINLSNGSYGYTDELIKASKGGEFIPIFFARSVFDSAIPFPPAGFTALTTFTYLVGGYFGLLYQGPILAILFLIVSERVATKLFGSFVGLITLALLVTDFEIIKNGTMLMTDPIFSIFVILGCFFLIKFISEGRNKLLLLSSIFLAGSAFFRTNGVILFPIEILLVFSYFLIPRILQNKYVITKNNFLTQFTTIGLKLNPFKISLYVLVPWMVFFLFLFSYNEYFFGNPFTEFHEEAYLVAGGNPMRIPDITRPDLIPSVLTFDSYRFEWINFYGKAILSDPVNTVLLNFSSTNDFNSVNNSLPAAFSYLILFVGLGISLYTKRKRIEIIVLLTFVFGFVLVFSSYYLTYVNMIERFVLPVLPLSFMILGFVIHNIWKISFGRILINRGKTFSKFFKIGLLIILIIMSLVSLLENKKIQDLLESGFNLKNPTEFLERYPLEKLPEKSIIIDNMGYRTLEYNAIHFNPVIGNWKIKNSEPDIESMQLMQKQIDLINQDYQLFSFKEHINENGLIYFRYIEKNYELILKDYSETFCKMELAEDTKNSDKVFSQSDDICYVYRDSVIPKN